MSGESLITIPEGPIETGLVFDVAGNSLHWHLPNHRSSGYLPDSQDLWEVLWSHRLKGGSGLLGGVAHTHPWYGWTGYSQEDVTTFASVEEGLGQRLRWPIATYDQIFWFAWVGPGKYDYKEVVSPPFPLAGLEKLRLLSGLSK